MPCDDVSVQGMCGSASLTAELYLACCSVDRERGRSEIVRRNELITFLVGIPIVCVRLKEEREWVREGVQSEALVDRKHWR